MAKQQTDASMVAAFIASRGVTRIAVGETTLATRLDIRHTPSQTRIAQSRFAADNASEGYGSYCEDAPCCGCCGMENGVVIRKGRAW
jgi:hypothetical protein